MENSKFADIYGIASEELDKVLVNQVKDQDLLKVQGVEGMSIGESFTAFFREFSTSIDRRMAVLAKAVHTVEYEATQKYLQNNNILYVKNTGVEILTPECYTPGFGNLNTHVQVLVDGVYIISSLKTESTRLYDWLKQIVKKGRVDKSFNWTISDFDRAVEPIQNYIKNLPEDGRRNKYNLGQVYVNFDECFGSIHKFNTVVKTLGHRDVEVITRELTNCYEIGQLLVKKIHANDITISPEAIIDIELVVNKFIALTNLCGVLMVLLNEMTAVFNSQIETLNKLK